MKKTPCVKTIATGIIFIISTSFVWADTVATPSFSPGGGTYNIEKTVVITCSTPGATILYTLDGSDPNNGTIIASGDSIYVDHSLTLKAVAQKAGMTTSAGKSSIYNLTVSTPSFSIAGGTYNTEKTVVITCATAGATVHYTTSGLDPTESDPVIASGDSVYVDHSLTLKAKAWKGSMTPSNVKSATYQLLNVVVATPVFTPDGGTYNTEQNVVITCDTLGATIRYTIDGSDPNTGSIYEPNSIFVVDHTLTLKAKAWKEGLPPSSVKSAEYNLIVAAPVFTPDGGLYNTEQNVVITCATPGATIRYTLDGSDPNMGSVYEPNSIIFIDHSLTLKAVARKDSCNPGFKSAYYQIVVATPVFTPNGGTYNSEQQVMITCTTPGATIHYTTTGLTPTESDPIIASGSSLYVDHSLSLKAKAWKGNMTPSSVKSATYQIVVATPVFTPDGGSYSTEQNVIITCAIPDATIHYTTNNLDPTENDPVIASGSSIYIDHNLTLKAKAWKGNFTPSNVKSAVYQLVVADTVFSPNGGYFSSDPNVIITCTTPGVEIHYTINMINPTKSDPLIANGDSTIVSVNPMTVLKARAFKIGWTSSNITTALYYCTKYSGGTGNPDNPYLIFIPEEIYLLSLFPEDFSKSFKLMANIDMRGYMFTTAIIAPDTSSAGFFQGVAFTGTFDGNGHKITNFTINGENNDYLGLFGYTDSGSKIENLGIENFSVSGNYYVGGLVGISGSGSIISNCYATGTVSGEWYVAGLAGVIGHGNIIMDCYATGTVSALPHSQFIGGLIGVNNSDSIIIDCYATGAVSASSYSYLVGGLAGANDGSIIDCYATGNVSGDYNVGGLIGGLSGNGGIINQCYSAGSVNGREDVGGLTGYNSYGSINNSYSTGAASGSYYDVGGLVGTNNGGNISNSYSTGAVSGSSSVGGLVGEENNVGTITNSFWDIQTSGRTTSVGGTGKTTAQMQTLSTFTSAGWEFNVWQPGRIGNALRFDGMDDYVKIPGYNGISGASPRTVSVWFKTSTDAWASNSTVSYNMSLVQWGHDNTGEMWMLFLNPDRSVRLGAYDGGVQSSTPLNDGLWHNVVAVLPEGRTSSEDILLYVDGQLDAAPVYSAVINTNTADMPVHIGAYKMTDGSISNYFQGLIDDVRIYNRALDASEIVPDALPESGLVTHWAMNESAGFIAHDSVSSYDGQLYNMSPVWAICEGTNYPRLQWQIPETDWICPDGVNIEDVDYFVGQWLENDCNSSNDNCGGVDIDTSGKVDLEDWAFFAQSWLEGV